jgi:PAS domain S-box-containing protein
MAAGAPVALSCASGSANTDPESRDFLARLGHASVLILPFAVLGKTVGELVLASDGHDLSDPGWIGFARSLAAQFGQNVALGQSLKHLHQSEEQYRVLFDHNPSPMWVHDLESLKFLAVNDAAVHHYGWTREEFLGMSVTDILPAEIPALVRVGNAAGEESTPHAGGVWRHRKKDGGEIAVELAASTIPFQGRSARLTLAADVTERTLLHTQLAKVQKMEAVGQLAGGIAHDFNNLLGVITGYSELLIKDVPANSIERKRGEEIRAAADRAAALTHQLLAFSRRQILQPTVLDLGNVVADVAKMLQRIIGDDIQLVIESTAGLGRVRADAGQIEQVIVNLALNARDAMPSGGRLLIQTANSELDDACVRTRPDARAGAYVRLAVSDTGHGMDATTIARIFEPFFTTKEEGKGTGLGLSSVYGIVRQSGGSITVTSEPGHGTKFEVYLPRVDAEVAAQNLVEAAAPPGGNETIWVVEDADALRLLARELLESAGYTVLDAEAADQALAIVEATSAPIHLVLTDMVMPRMSGQELASRLAVIRPQTRLVVMSGYSAPAAGDQGTSDLGAPFLQKPFTLDALLRTVRRALDAEVSLHSEECHAVPLETAGSKLSVDLPKLLREPGRSVAVC